MGRPKNKQPSHATDTPFYDVPPLPPVEPGPNTGLLVDAVNGGAVERKNLPAMLAQAKLNGDVDLVEAILKACRE